MNANVVVAFLLAPLATPLVFMASEALVEWPPSSWGAWWAAGILVAVLTYPSVIVFGIPAYLLFRKWTVRSVGAYAFAGGLIGLLTAVAWRLVLRQGMPPRFWVSCLVSGLLSVLLFRRMARAGA